MRAIFIILNDDLEISVMEFASLKKGRLQGWNLKQNTFFKNAQSGDILKVPHMLGNGHLHIKFDRPAKIFLQHCFYQATLEE